MYLILRSEISFNVTIVKVVALVNALAKLHNFCVGDRHGYDEGILDSMPIDMHNYLRSHGLVSLNAIGSNGDGERDLIPTQLLGAGHHSNDYPQLMR